MNKKIAVILLLGIMLIAIAGLVSALDSLGTFKQNDVIIINQVCSDATYITISSVAYPNSTVAISSINMTSAGSGRFYHDFSNTSAIGRYDVLGISDSCEETFAVYFEVTPNGKVFTAQNSIIYLGFILIILFTFFLTMYGAGRIEWKNQRSNEGKILTINHFKYVKVLLYTLAYFELMFLFGLSYKVSREVDIEGFAQFFNFIYQLFLHLMYPLMIGLIIIMFVIWIGNKKLSERLKLGLGK